MFSIFIYPLQLFKLKIPRNPMYKWIIIFMEMIFLKNQSIYV